MAAYPFQDLGTRLAKAGRADLLSVAYLRVWLRAQPDQIELHATLARQLQVIGKYEEAHKELQYLLTSKVEAHRESGRRLEVDVLRAEAWNLPEGHPRRLELLALAADKMKQLLQEAVQLARKNGKTPVADPEAPPEPIDPAAAREALIADANAPPVDANFDWFMQHSRALLGQSFYRLAADMQWRAFNLAATPAKRRQAFDAALATLISGNMSAVAIVEADQRVKLLAPDIALYKALTKLALSSGKLEIAERYAKLMLKLSLLQELQRWEHAQMTPAQAALNDGAYRKIKADNFIPHVNTTPLESSQIAPGPGVTFEQEVYRLGYEVFMARGNLGDAMRVAESAVKQLPNSLEWLKRLAQVSEWHAKPNISLNTWLTLATLQPTAEHWGHVKRLAIMLFDEEKLVLALKFEAKQSGDPETQIKVANILENQGKPRDALMYLEKAMNGTAPTVRLYDELIALAMRMQDPELIDHFLAKAQTVFPQKLGYAMQRAMHLNERGMLEKALSVLLSQRKLAEQTKDQAQLVVDDLYYWTFLAELARLEQRDELAIDALLIALEHNKLQETDYDALANLADEQQPDLAIAVFRFAFERLGQARHARAAANIYLRIGAIDQLQVYLSKLTPALVQEMENDLNFLTQRASASVGAGKFPQAKRDLAKALILAPNNDTIKAQTIWTLMAAKDARALQTTLRRWEKDSRHSPLLHGPFAAAWMSLSEPYLARPYFVRQARAKPDFMWYLAFADCLEQTGMADSAWSYRRRAWLDLKQLSKTKLDRQVALQTASLALRFASADRAHQLLAAFVRQNSGTAPLKFAKPSISTIPNPALELNADSDVQTAAAVLRQVWKAPEHFDPIKAVPIVEGEDTASDRSSAKELTLSYLLSSDQTDLAKGWLLSNYAQGLQRPAWAELNIALAQKDNTTLVRLLDTVSDWLPKLDRVEALQQTRQHASAQTLAHQLAEQRPDSHDAAQRYRQTIEDRGSVIKFDYASGNQSSLKFSGPKFELTSWLTPSIGFESKLSASTISSSDNNFPANLATRETLGEISLKWLRETGKLGVTLLSRSSVTSTSGAMLQFEESFDTKYKLSSSISLRAPSSETQGMRVYGNTDQAKIAGRLDFSQREYFSGQLAATRYNLNGAGSIGRAFNLNAELGHLLRIEYPDMAIKASAVVGRTKANANLQAAAGAYVNANNNNLEALFLPASTTSFSVSAVYGASARSRNVGGAFAPFAELALGYDSANGPGYNATIGFTTGLIGADRLQFAVSFNSKNATNPKSSKEISMGYRLRF
jgi:polysaccharide biosynthesis protein PelB